MGSAVSSMNWKSNYSVDHYELNQQQESKGDPESEQQAPQTLHGLEAEFNSLKWTIFEVKKQLKNGGVCVHYECRTRLLDLQNQLESIQRQFERISNGNSAFEEPINSHKYI